MSFLTIDTEKCAKDGICVEECPGKLIIFKNQYPESITDAEKRCIQCGHCMAVCPNGAIKIAGLDADLFRPIHNELNVSPDQTEQLIRSRRSIRNYKDKPINRDTLQKLIAIASSSPTGGNSQLVQWRVVDNRDELDGMIDATIDFMRILVKNNNPFAINYRLDRVIKAREKGIDGILRGAPALIIAHVPKEYGLGTVDGSIALSYLDLTANTYGLGCCWAGFFMMAAVQSKELHQLMKLPEGNICVGALMVGYPKYKYKMIPPRREAKIIWS